MKPVNGWILVEKVKKEEVTKSGIVIPDQVGSKIQKCKVIDISTDVLRACKDEKKDLPYEIGDTVILHSQLGIEAVPTDGDGKIMFVKFDAVMGVEK